MIKKKKQFVLGGSITTIIAPSRGNKESRHIQCV